MVKNFLFAWTLLPWSNQPLDIKPMKLQKNKFQRWWSGLPAAVILWGFCSAAALADQTDKESSHHSTFILPSNPGEGHDPFFPDSLRPYESAMVNNHTAEITSLIFKGISGPPDHRLVIINNHTFAAGDEEDVITPQGRIHVRCVEIKADSVIVESGGQRVVLTYSTNP
jgi:hypothetical protein